MHRFNEQTGPFLHAADDAYQLSFETGGTPRGFTVVVASARTDLFIDESRNGVAIVDDDTLQVVLDEHARDDPAACRSEVARIRSMDWSAFSEFCRRHPRYRARTPDIDETRARPYPGSRLNQARRGRTPTELGGSDIRSARMIEADGDPRCPYTFPPVRRDQAIRELLCHPLRKGEDNRLRLSWDIRMHMVEDWSGRAGPTAVDAATDPAWQEHVARTPEIAHEIFADMLTPYLSQGVSTWGSDDEGRYEFDVEGQSGGNLVLARIDRTDMSFSGQGAFGRLLEEIDEGDLRDIWKLKRTLDHDLSPERRLADFGPRLNGIRARFERELRDELTTPEL